jgi:hypothetical protein
MLRVVEPDGWRRFRLGHPRLRILNGFAYLLSLGFRRASLLPARSAGFFLRFDRWSQPLAPVVGLRALAVWERLEGGGADATA